MKQKDYQPPYTVTTAILNLVANISEAVGRLTILTDQAKTLRHSGPGWGGIGVSVVLQY